MRTYGGIKVLSAPDKISEYRRTWQLHVGSVLGTRLARQITEYVSEEKMAVICETGTGVCI